MRIHLHLSPNRELVPFNYQQSLVGAFHRWLGENELHDDISLYSLSWLDGAQYRKNGFDFPRGARFCISSPIQDLHQRVVAGIFKGQYIRWGMEVREVNMLTDPTFQEEERFRLKSPVLIKRTPEGEKHAQYYFPENKEANALLTETLHKKMTRAGLSPDVKVSFDPDYKNPKKKLITFNKIDIKASFCPVIIKGDPAAIQFAWNVGVGNSTGIGFGCLG